MFEEILVAAYGLKNDRKKLEVVTILVTWSITHGLSGFSLDKLSDRIKSFGGNKTSIFWMSHQFFFGWITTVGQTR